MVPGLSFSSSKEGWFSKRGVKWSEREKDLQRGTKGFEKNEPELKEAEEVNINERFLSMVITW